MIVRADWCIEICSGYCDIIESVLFQKDYLRTLYYVSYPWV